jgi:hypothetical protein
MKRLLCHRQYTTAEVELLAAVDQAHAQLSASGARSSGQRSSSMRISPA